MGAFLSTLTVDNLAYKKLATTLSLDLTGNFCQLLMK